MSNIHTDNKNSLDNIFTTLVTVASGFFRTLNKRSPVKYESSLDRVNDTYTITSDTLLNHQYGIAIELMGSFISITYVRFYNDPVDADYNSISVLKEMVVTSLEDFCQTEFINDLNTYLPVITGKEETK